MSDLLAYSSVHIYLNKVKGAASEHLCAECRKEAAEWSYDHADPEETLDERGRAYSQKFEHYRPLCRSCHRKFDRGEACNAGHPWTPETTYVYRGYRLCRKCRTANQKMRRSFA